MDRTQLIAHLKDISATFYPAIAGSTWGARLSPETLSEIISELEAPADNHSHSIVCGSTLRPTNAYCRPEELITAASNLIIHLDQRSNVSFSKGDNELRRKLRDFLNHNPAFTCASTGA